MKKRTILIPEPGDANYGPDDYGPDCRALCGRCPTGAGVLGSARDRARCRECNSMTSRQQVPLVGKRLTQLMEERGLSYRQLADLAGVGVNTVRAICRGTREPGLAVICILSKGLAAW